MDSGSETSDESVGERQPAPVVKATPAKKAPAKKAVAKKAPVKKAAAKATPVKKAPVKKAVAKKAPAKKAPAKKAPVKKAAAKATPVKSSAPILEPQLDLTRQAPTAGTPPTAPNSPTAKPRLTTSKIRDVSEYLADKPITGPMAMVASLTQEMVNDLLPFLVGVGIPVDPLDTTISLPGMGDIEVTLGLTVTGVSAVLDSANGGRIKVIVAGAGEVATRTVDYAGDAVSAESPAVSPILSAASAMLPSAPIPVIGEALVQPFMYLKDNGQIIVGLDLNQAEFVSIATDPNAPVPEGVEPAGWPGMLAMFGVLLGGIGGDLFAALSEHVGEAMVELDEEVGSVFVKLGGRPGPIALSVSSGLVTISVPADSSVKGAALPVPIAGKRIGVGLATSVVDHVAHIALERAAGELPLPFELKVSLDEQSVGGQIKNSRIFPESLPDLRGALRTEVRTRLLRGQLELSVQSAWIEMPSIVPSFVNQISKRLGGLVALAPFKVKFPALIPVPLPDGAGSLDVRIDDLRVTADGIGLVASLA
ncbi:MAG: hypothetical protein V9F03_16845 [Microthrixaceae bacterium]